MTRTGLKYFCITVVALSALATPAAARHIRHREPARVYITSPLIKVDYSHNYGPGDQAMDGAYRWATYDGPFRASCEQSAAAYRGQDGRRHPCM